MKKWTSDEEKLLKELVGKTQVSEIANMLNKTEEAVRHKMRKLGIARSIVRKVWTEEEINYLKENWGKISMMEMARKLNVSRVMIEKQADLLYLKPVGRKSNTKWDEERISKLKELSKTKPVSQLAKYFKTTKHAISDIAARYNIKLIEDKFYWTEEEIELLKECSKKMTLLETANVIERPVAAIRMQSKRLGIEFISKENKWKDEDNQTLIRLVNEGKTKFEIARIMNKKSRLLTKKAKELGLKLKKSEFKMWSKEEEKKLIELAKTKTIDELVDIFERDDSSIQNKASSLNIKIYTAKKKWTSEEEKELIDLIVNKKKSPKEVSKILNRTQSAITIRINQLGYKVQTSVNRKWTEEEIDYLKNNWGKYSIDKIAKTLNRTESALSNKAFEYKLGSFKDNNYDGLTIKEISDILGISIETVSVNWISLGLNVKSKKVTNSRKYRYVTIEDLMEFLRLNQNIWDSRKLERNILGIEPDWLIEKRRNDIGKDKNEFNKIYILKQQLIKSRDILLEIKEIEEKAKQKRI